MEYTIRAGEFEGPLELLLNLIEEQKLSINTVSLATVTEGYFAYIKTLEAEVAERRVTFEYLAAFLVVASTLILIKSRSLLPGFTLSKEEEEDISTLTERLETYQRIKALTEELGPLLERRKPLFSRPPHAYTIPAFLPPKEFALVELPKILHALLEVIPSKELLPEKKIAEVVSIEERIKELEERIERGIVKSFTEFVGNKNDQTNVIVSFLALLELIKLGIVAARQDERFSAIHLAKPEISHG